MKVFVTGVGGQLGFDVISRLVSRGVECIGSDILDDWSDAVGEKIKNKVKYEKLDITNSQEVEKIICDISPDVIVHCAAWTAVDAAEAPENHDKVHAINVDGTQNIANVAKKLDAKMVYISTDYVFDGQGTEPWKPDCKDYNPLSVYGQSKLDGEFAVCNTIDKFFIVRTAWVFGLNGNNFIKIMLNAIKQSNDVCVVNDQIGTPTFTYDLARLLCDMIETDRFGYYHATNEGGYISWYDFAVEIFKQAGLNIKVNAVTTKEYGVSVAARPFNSRLDCSKLVDAGFDPLPVWEDAVNRYLKAIDVV